MRANRTELIARLRNWAQAWFPESRGGAIHVLVIDDVVPDHVIGAGAPRAYELLRALSVSDARVTFFSTRNRPDGLRQKPLKFAGFRRAYGNAATLPDYLAGNWRRFDAIVVSRRHNLVTLNSILRQRTRTASDPPIVFDSEAIFAEREEMHRRVMNRPAFPHDMSVAAELALADTAQIVIAVSEQDAEKYREAGHQDVRVIGHALDPSLSGRPFGGRRGFLFVGPAYADDTPNSDSLAWFADRVLPAIRAETGDETMLIHVGICLAPGISARYGKLIVGRGPLPVLAAEFDAARVFVAPTRFAAGIPLKVYEAAAHGLPCVITPLLARQLDWRHDREALVVENPDDFARACLALHSDERLWNRLRNEAFRRTADECDRGRMNRAVADLCHDIALRRGLS